MLVRTQNGIHFDTGPNKSTKLLSSAPIVLFPVSFALSTVLPHSFCKAFCSSTLPTRAATFCVGGRHCSSSCPWRRGRCKSHGCGGVSLGLHRAVALVALKVVVVVAATKPFASSVARAKLRHAFVALLLLGLYFQQQQLVLGFPFRLFKQWNNTRASDASRKIQEICTRSQFEMRHAEILHCSWR